jgi:hypothetical protein
VGSDGIDFSHMLRQRQVKRWHEMCWKYMTEGGQTVGLNPGLQQRIQFAVSGGWGLHVSGPVGVIWWKP